MQKWTLTLEIPVTNSPQRIRLVMIPQKKVEGLHSSKTHCFQWLNRLQLPQICFNKTLLEVKLVDQEFCLHNRQMKTLREVIYLGLKEKLLAINQWKLLEMVHLVSLILFILILFFTLGYVFEAYDNYRKCKVALKRT